MELILGVRVGGGWNAAGVRGYNERRCDRPLGRSRIGTAVAGLGNVRNKVVIVLWGDRGLGSLPPAQIAPKSIKN